MSLTLNSLNLPTMYTIFSSRLSQKPLDKIFLELEHAIYKVISKDNIMINYYIGAPIKVNYTPYIYNVYYIGNENIKNTNIEQLVQKLIIEFLKDYLI